MIDQYSVPVENIPVYFEVVSFPGETDGFSFEFPVVISDSMGIAQTYFTMGSGEGDYHIAARIHGNYKDNILIYTIHARRSNWVFMLIIGLLGGLGLFLMGLKMMSDGMQQAAGDKMRSVLSTLTDNRFLAVGVGAFVTMIIQSSSATTVMLVSFVQSGLMQFAQSLGIILGADIGTTITAQLIAFKLTDYSLLMVGIGFGIQFFSKNKKIRNLGKTVLGFGVLFFGMHIMSESMYPLRSFDPFIETLLKLENPLIGIIVGALFTALIQSSSAFVGILIILSTQGLLSLEAAIPLLLGANLGTAITAILASLNTNREAKKVALAHTIFKIVGVLLFVWWIPAFASIVEAISPKGASRPEEISRLAEVLPRQIANAHTLFNVVLTVATLPFTGLFSRFINKILPPETAPPKEVFKVKYLDEKNVPTPALALNLAKSEVIRMGYNVYEMTSDIIIPFFMKDVVILKNIESKEKKIDFLREEINSYIMKITRQDIPEERVHEAFQIMYTVKEFELMADIISKSLIKKAYKWAEKPVEFSDEGKRELREYHSKTQKQIRRAIEVFRDVNLEKARIMKQKYKEYRTLAIELERQHYSRLKDAVLESVASSETHLELISSLKVILSHATNIARILLEWTVPTRQDIPDQEPDQ
ncbi:MAG: Na/Pi cotransporter family protein [Bacteroidales bacterium]|nr:MAG: Na/Pi cotransporter family protein [Bacteroidales bacterium]